MFAAPSSPNNLILTRNREKPSSLIDLSWNVPNGHGAEFVVRSLYRNSIYITYCISKRSFKSKIKL